MTIYYVASDGDNSDGLTWAKAFTTIGGPTTYAGGDVVYVDKTFQETVSGDMPGADGGYELPVRFYCVDRTGDPEPPDETDYSPQTTQYVIDSAGSLSFNQDGAVWHGFYFKATTFITLNAGGVSTGPVSQIDCTFEVGQDYYCFIFSAFRGGGLINPTFKGAGGATDNHARISFTGSTGSTVYCIVGGDFNDATNDYQINIFASAAASVGLDFIGCDFQDYGSLAAGVGIHNTGNVSLTARFIGCYLPTNNWAYTSMSSTGRGRIEFLGCDDGADQETDTIRAWNGELDTWGAGIASRAVYRTDGFKRKDQSNAQCWRIDSTTKMDYGSPFKLFPIATYNDTTGSTRKVTVEYLLGDASATDDLDYTEMWLEVSYFDDAGTLLTVEDNRESPDLQATPTSHATSTEAWTTTDAESSTAKRKMEITTSGTVAQEGFITVNVYVAGIGTNDSIYIDPLGTVGAA